MPNHGDNKNELLYYKLFNFDKTNYNINDLELLAKTMKKINNNNGSSGSIHPAIVTYFGQFIDHDITLENKTILGKEQVDIENLLNGRTSWFDLDSVYGFNNEYLTENNNTEFKIGYNDNGDEDMPRDLNGKPIIADARNQENIIIQNIQLSCFKFHNKLINILRKSNLQLNNNELIVKTKRILINHYQKLVIHEFLGRVLLPEIYDMFFVSKTFDINKSEIYRNIPKSPIEVAGAVFRCHNWVRNEYQITKNEKRDIFSMTNKDLRGGKVLDSGLNIDWHLFMPMQGYNGFQVTEKFNTALVENLFILPLNKGDSLARMNLVRGNVYGLACGQDIARYYGYPVLCKSPEKSYLEMKIDLEENYKSINTEITLEDLNHLNNVFGDNTPLWYYILKESEIIGEGNHLGYVGSRIIGEFFYSLLYKSNNSILNNDFKLIKGECGCVEEDKYLYCDFFNWCFDLEERNPEYKIPSYLDNKLLLDIN